MSSLDEGVSAWEEMVVIPTYQPPPPDPHPMFLDARFNQGSSGRVYPNPLTDRLAGEKSDRTYKAVFLENQYIRLMILPEIGGRVHAAVDKINGYEFIYHQHVIKPALIGLLGPWVSGGMEFNWPQHHRPSTFMPVDHIIEEDDDGGRTVWLGEHEPMARTKGMVGICLRPGKALMEMKVRLYNRTPHVRSFMWWVNVGVHAGERYQVVFPPDVTFATDHSRRNMSYYPVARGSYCGVDYSDGVDVSWYRNIPVPSSFFVYQSSYDFLGGYDHALRAGLVHVANRHIAPGKKFFTWGQSDFAKAWERNLTDEDGPYIELMAGAYTDNQPDFSWLMPYEMRRFSQLWYPIRQIGLVKNANDLLAVSLDSDNGCATFGVCPTELLLGARVKLTAGQRVLFEQKADLAPENPLVEQVELPKDLSQASLMLIVFDQGGGELIRYVPEPRPEAPLPEPATPPGPPEKIATTEELYLTGLHSEQYRYPAAMPETYWREGLRRDLDDARTNSAMGRMLLRRGQFVEAEDHFRRLVRRLTRHNFNPNDGEAFYHLGLSLRFQGRLDEAYAGLYKATWNYAWQSAGYYALAEIDCLRGDLAVALEHLDRSLETNALQLKARNLKATVCRRLGCHRQAETLVRETIAMDPLDFWSRNELALLCRDDGHSQQADACCQELSRLMRGAVQTYLDIAFDYAGAGFYPEAADLLERLLPAGDAPVHPMVLYSLGYFAQEGGHIAQAESLYSRASTMPTDYCFPWRLEEEQVLLRALAVNHQDANACYYLGNLLFDKNRHAEAVRYWQDACRLRPDFAMPWRNLGIACYNIQKDPAKAREHFVKAFRLNSTDPRMLLELDQLLLRLGDSAGERLERLGDHLDLVVQRDDLSVEYASLCNQTGQPRKALDVILSRQFHPWEGGAGRVSEQYVKASLAVGRKALGVDSPAEALEHFQAALRRPENLGEGKRPHYSEAHVHYWIGRARQAKGDEAGARESFRAASELPGDISASTYYAAIAMERLGQKQAAKKLLEGLLEHALNGLDKPMQAGFLTSVPKFVLFQEDLRDFAKAECRYQAGLAQLGLGRAEEARKHFSDAVALNPNHADALDELASLQRAGSTE